MPSRLLSKNVLSKRDLARGSLLRRHGATHLSLVYSQNPKSCDNNNIKPSDQACLLLREAASLLTALDERHLKISWLIEECAELLQSADVRLDSFYLDYNCIDSNRPDSTIQNVFSQSGFSQFESGLEPEHL